MEKGVPSGGTSWNLSSVLIWSIASIAGDNPPWTPNILPPIKHDKGIKSNKSVKYFHTNGEPYCRTH